MTGSRLREAVRRQAFPDPPHPLARALGESVAEAGGDSVRGVIFFGSRKSGARQPGAGSAWDVFILTADYRAFYDHLARTGRLHRSPGLLARINGVLAPSQLSIRVEPATVPGVVKAAVISVAAFTQATSPARRDHFVCGRMFQPVEVVYARTPADGDAIAEALAAACGITLDWVRPDLPPQFAVDDYTRTLLRTSYGGEIRPEPEGRADSLWTAQREGLTSLYGPFLEDAMEAGALTRAADGRFTLTAPVTAAERRQVTAYFRRSKVRATARWGKHIVTFDDWLDFIVRKVERHTGQPLVLTPRERRLPVIFLWPRLLRFLRDRDRPR